PLTLRESSGVGGRRLSGEPGIHPVLDLLAVRLQRPLHLRPVRGQLLTGGEGRASRSPLVQFLRSGRSRYCPSSRLNMVAIAGWSIGSSLSSRTRFCWLT